MIGSPEVKLLNYDKEFNNNSKIHKLQEQEIYFVENRHSLNNDNDEYNTMRKALQDDIKDSPSYAFSARKNSVRQKLNNQISYN